MKSILNGNISEVNVDMQNNLTSQFQIVGHGGNPLCLSTCIHKHN